MKLAFFGSAGKDPECCEVLSLNSVSEWLKPQDVGKMGSDTTSSEVGVMKEPTACKATSDSLKALVLVNSFHPPSIDPIVLVGQERPVDRRPDCSGWYTVSSSKWGIWRRGRSDDSGWRRASVSSVPRLLRSALKLFSARMLRVNSSASVGGGIVMFD